MPVIYNEIEPYAVEWLRNLSGAGHIASGQVEPRSIADLVPDDVASFTQAHFFAGLGGWSHALRLAGWPDHVPVWTGSCPCQPFSVAGRKKGFSDERHLWPTWFHLIRECAPPVIFGEQVASPDGLEWLDTVSSDLEGAGYAFAAADLCAAGVGAPHLRQRLYFVALAADQRLNRVDALLRQDVRGRVATDLPQAPGCGALGVVGHTDSQRAGRVGGASGRAQGEVGRDGADGDVPSASGKDGYWSDAEWLACTDGKARPIEPGTFPLVDGVSNRVGRIRAYGNAIVPQVAATFIRSVMESL